MDNLRKERCNLGNLKWKEEVYPFHDCDGESFTIFFALVKIRRAKSHFFSSTKIEPTSRQRTKYKQ